MYDHALPVTRGRDAACEQRERDAVEEPARHRRRRRDPDGARRNVRDGDRASADARRERDKPWDTNGASANATAPPIAMAITMSCAVPLPSAPASRPTTSAILPPAVNAITAKPAMMLTRLTTRLEPIAAVGDTPARCAIAPMAAICQTVPGRTCRGSIRTRCARRSANGSRLRPRAERAAPCFDEQQIGREHERARGEDPPPLESHRLRAPAPGFPTGARARAPRIQ